MVFKNKLFFSSKKSSDSSSPDGSNSPRSLRSNSPIRSDKKKPKSTTSKDETSTSSFSAVACRQTQVKDGVRKKEIKGKEIIPTTKTTTTPAKPSVSKLNKGGGEVPSSVSPILASSLGLNRIKTRSGPLPQESFFSFKGDKGSATTSNLSRPGPGGGGRYSDGNSSSGKSGIGGGKKKEMLDMMESFGVGDNVCNSNSKSIGGGGGGLSREQTPIFLAKSRLVTGQSSSEAGNLFAFTFFLKIFLKSFKWLIV